MSTFKYRDLDNDLFIVTPHTRKDDVPVVAVEIRQDGDVATAHIALDHVDQVIAAIRDARLRASGQERKATRSRDMTYLHPGIGGSHIHVDRDTTEPDGTPVIAITTSSRYGQGPFVQVSLDQVEELVTGIRDAARQANGQQSDAEEQQESRPGPAEQCEATAPQEVLLGQPRCIRPARHPGSHADGKGYVWPDRLTPTETAFFVEHTRTELPTPADETDKPNVQVWPLQRVLTEVRCGSQDWSWEEEWADLDRRHADTGYLAGLEQQIRKNGITTPVLIGSDGRLWNGHHRLRIAVRLGIDYVPVELTSPADETVAALTAEIEELRTERDVALANVKSHQAHSLSIQHDARHRLPHVYAVQRVRSLAQQWHRLGFPYQQYAEMLDKAIGAYEPCQGRGKCPWMNDAVPAENTALKRAHVALATQAGRDQAALERVRKALDDAEWGSPDRFDVILEIRDALELPRIPVQDADTGMSETEARRRLAAVELLCSGRPGYHPITVKSLLTAMSEATRGPGGE